MGTSNTIGFATKFYTLWEYSTENVYRVDAYGNHVCVGTKHNYNYLRNISTDLRKVSELYHNLPIDESLRGKFRSFSKVTDNAPNNYFWVGKYCGRLIDDIMDIDFSYCLWASTNLNNRTSGYILSHPKYLTYLEVLKEEKEELLKSSTLLNSGDVVELEFTRNGYDPSEDGSSCYTDANYGNIGVTVICSGVHRVSGIYPYLMPVINGKAFKTKGKKVMVTIIEILETSILDGRVNQVVRVS